MCFLTLTGFQRLLRRYVIELLVLCIPQRSSHRHCYLVFVSPSVWLWVCLSPHPKMHYCTYFHQTFSIGTFCDNDERVNFWVQVTLGSIMIENTLFGLILKINGRNLPKLCCLVYLRPKMNWLDFESRLIKVEVTARSDMKIWGRISAKWLEVSITFEGKVGVMVNVKAASRSNVWVNYCGRQRHPHQHFSSIRVSSSSCC